MGGVVLTRSRAEEEALKSHPIMSLHASYSVMMDVRYAIPQGKKGCRINLTTFSWVLWPLAGLGSHRYVRIRGLHFPWIVVIVPLRRISGYSARVKPRRPRRVSVVLLRNRTGARPLVANRPVRLNRTTKPTAEVCLVGHTSPL
ncbi:hypothetical protein B296_00009346 [Ensete ventricosum]|uniref:Uncharacterized protein n=1 Tax=Ensete ventricosum TaxID=4639 RepID=A0A426ZR93_ENSVE|nr:hypothetical protein B296_00009346 [Ensete ventricosum]